MAKSKPANEPRARRVKAEKVTHHEDGSTEILNPVEVPGPTPAEIRAAAKAEKEAAKAAKAAERAAKKLERESARAAKVLVTAEQRAAAKAEREARLAELGQGKKYTGSMLALADRVRQGAYVKSITGQLRSVNELADILDPVPVDNVIRLAKIVLNLETNPYGHLNIGQQSMNLRNKMRGAIKNGVLTYDRIRYVIEENGFATGNEIMEAKARAKAEREARAAATKAAKSAKAATETADA